MVGINIREGLSTTGTCQAVRQGQVDALDPPAKIGNRPFQCPGTECAEPCGELGLTASPPYPRNVSGSGGYKHCSGAGPSAQHQGWRPRAWLFTILFTIMQCNFCCCCSLEKDVQENNAQGLARWSSRNLEMPAAGPYYALISIRGDHQGGRREPPPHVHHGTCALNINAHK